MMLAAALLCGDQATTDWIVAEIQARYANGQADSSELMELGRAMERVSLGADL
ncbi:hypothetical protein ACJ6WF_17025 [Streptomyces sp. MMS24-I2-30]|uniref:hypothetical protein n=1 Tax=Streptomyces sp. MMS24-I2-30 TaxID=3351564 RepID=UPI003896E832